ncbi:efflux RND transporter periplasmic adaptor subunit [uncultured Cetobacterium sp.]|uniref:efflux RND transporter periplasmic adaptor subunit n=2 Tax=uncultured Cetobacterium sp. TaxID=527638 RepID=UPI00261F56B7|nr:efflux RND transporter periplasmic adaptor subunit [uncultured Cetobacterium sp.]
MKNKYLVIISALIFLSCGKNENEKVENIKPVVYKIVQPKNNTIKRTYSGTIKSDTLSNLSFRVGGTINNRIAELGNIVSKGEVLATLDNSEYLLKYNKSIADLSKAKAVLAENKANFNRSQVLYLENSISKASYDNAIAQYKSAVANLKALTEAVNLSKLKLSYTKLKSPENGVIGQVKSEVNQVVNPGETVFVLSSDGERNIEFNVSQSVIGSIYQGQPIKINVEALNNKSISGTITNIGPLSIGYGSTYPVKAKIIDGNSNVKVGMIADIIITTPIGNPNSISVPIGSIITGPDNQKYVFVIKDVKNNIGVVKKQEVVLSKNIVSDGVIIKSGLVKGDFIVTKGSSQIMNDQKVSLIKGEN